MRMLIWGKTFVRALRRTIKFVKSEKQKEDDIFLKRGVVRHLTETLERLRSKDLGHYRKNRTVPFIHAQPGLLDIIAVASRRKLKFFSV